MPQTGKGDLTSITLDDDVTDIDLNGVTTILSIDDATGRTIGAGTYSFQDTAEKLSKTSSKSLINGKAVKVNDDDTLDFDKYTALLC